MAIVDRIKAICLKPKEEWEVIAGESTSAADLLKSYALPLAVIGAVAGFIGMSLVGRSILFVTIRTPIASGLAGAILHLAGSLAAVFGVGLLIDALAPQFGAEKNKAQALKVAVYSFTPAWVAGVLAVIPALDVLVLIAFGYAIYLMYLGLIRLMKCPQDKAPVYTAVVGVSALVLALVVRYLVRAVT